MAWIKILNPVMINGEPAAVGSLVEVADGEAGYLIGQGMAAAAAVPAPEPEPAQVPEVKPARTRKHSPDTED